MRDVNFCAGPYARPVVIHIAVHQFLVTLIVICVAMSGVDLNAVAKRWPRVTVAFVLGMFLLWVQSVLWDGAFWNLAPIIVLCFIIAGRSPWRWVAVVAMNLIIFSSGGGLKGVSLLMYNGLLVCLIAFPPREALASGYYELIAGEWTVTFVDLWVLALSLFLVVGPGISELAVSLDHGWVCDRAVAHRPACDNNVTCESRSHTLCCIRPVPA